MNDSWRRERAEETIAEWSVARGDFVAALEKLVSEKRSAGEWKFNREEEVALAIDGAKRFFDEFSRKLVELSDGRYVYFAPDARSRERNHDNATCWAEYAFHAVSNGGARLPGKAYNERWYHPHKIANFDRIEKTLMAERCFVRLRKNNPSESSILFYGDVAAGILIQVITRLDQFGNADANLTEVTFEASTGKIKKLPRLVPLAEAVQTVVHYQTTAGSYPPDTNNISNPQNVRKGVSVDCGNGTNIAVIILIGQEKIHLKRCIEKLAALSPRQIFLVESQPDDGGVAIAKETAAKFGLRLESMYHKWPGNQADQFNWALDEIVVGGSRSRTMDGWILRLDADEYLTDELTEEIRTRLPQLNDVDGVVLKRRHVVGWLGDVCVKRGMYPARILRLFRRGKGRSDMKLMDEHIVVDGKVVEFDHDFVDHSLISFEEWKAKHRGYAKREAVSQLSGEKSTGKQAAKKEAYYKLPRYFRAVVYWSVRFILKGAILEGPKAWRWCWWHALWYRCLVDREIGRMSSGEIK